MKPYLASRDENNLYFYSELSIWSQKSVSVNEPSPLYYQCLNAFLSLSTLNLEPNLWVKFAASKIVQQWLGVKFIEAQLIFYDLLLKPNIMNLLEVAYTTFVQRSSLLTPACFTISVGAKVISCNGFLAFCDCFSIRS